MSKQRYLIIQDGTSKNDDSVLAVKETYPDIIVLTQSEARKIIDEKFTKVNPNECPST